MAINSEKLKFLFLKFLYRNNGIAYQIDKEYANYLEKTRAHLEQDKEISQLKIAKTNLLNFQKVSSNKMKSTCANQIEQKMNSSQSIPRNLQKSFSHQMFIVEKEQSDFLSDFTRQDPLTVHKLSFIVFFFFFITLLPIFFRSI